MQGSILILTEGFQGAVAKAPPQRNQIRLADPISIYDVKLRQELNQVLEPPPFTKTATILLVLLLTCDTWRVTVRHDTDNSPQGFETPF
jgi:hypothetical protein